MKIAFLASGTVRGSLSYRPLSFAKELVKRGHDVYILAPRFDKYSEFKDEKIFQIEGVKIVRPLQIRTSLFELGLIPYIISSAIVLHRLNPDIIHANKATPLSLGSLLPQLTRNSFIIFDADDLDSEVAKIETGSFLKTKILELCEKVLTKRANAIITASKFLQNRYLKIYPTKTVKHIPNGADFIVTKKVGVKKTSKNGILFIGLINRINILSPLFSVLKALKDQKISVTVTLIGNGKYLDYFKRLSKKLKIEDKVKFLGWIPQGSLQRHITVGDIGYCYMPNEITIQACSSMKVFQYLQYGVIPLVSNVGDLPFYVAYGKSGYIVKHDDAEQLQKVITNALKNKDERMSKIAYSKKYSGNVFSWHSLSKSLEKLYISLLKEKL